MKDKTRAFFGVILSMLLVFVFVTGFLSGMGLVIEGASVLATIMSVFTGICSTTVFNKLDI